jgi:hypothetical protein
VLPKKVGGLSLASVEDAMRALMSKWIIQALLRTQSNLQVLIRYRIMQLQPSYHAHGVLPLSGCSHSTSLLKVN